LAFGRVGREGEWGSSQHEKRESAMNRRRLKAIWATALVVTAINAVGTPSASGGSLPASQGVTATTIRVGIPYLDLSAVWKFGVKLDQGNYPDAYNALIADMNAHGGIDGRRIVPYLVPVNPIGTAPAATACTQLTEDDRVLVAIFPVQPDCYLQEHHTPTVYGDFQGSRALGGVPNFTTAPPPSVYDRLELSVFKRRGIFHRKEVGLFAGDVTDQDELRVVQSTLRSLHVPVVQTAVLDTPIGAANGYDQQFSVIVQRFKEAGVNEVIAIGTGSYVWPHSLQAIQSSYNPRWVATNEGALEAVVLNGSSTPSKYLTDMLASNPYAPNTLFWHTPSEQHCARVVHRAYPTDKMTPPTNPQISPDESFFAVEAACISLGLFATIAKAAGKNLTTSSFIQAGYRLRNAVVPGLIAPVSFGPGRPYVIGTVYPVTYDATHHSMKYSTTSLTH
jgi:hypothetical protein